MKLQPLLEGMWVIKNLDGKEKRFKNDQSPEAIAWKNSRNPEKIPSRRSFVNKVVKSIMAKPTLDEIYHYVSNIIGDIFPDGDPIDRMGPWMQRHRISMEDVDKAFKKHEKKTMYHYLGDGWEDIAQQAYREAFDKYHKHGKDVKPEYSNFWHMGKDGPVLSQNPWLTSEQQAKRRKNLHD